MPLDDLASGLLQGLGRILHDVFVNGVLEILVKGPGCLLLWIATPGRKKPLDCDRPLALVLGGLCWLVAGIVVFVP